MCSVSDTEYYLICNRCPNTGCMYASADVTRLIEANGDFWSVVLSGKKRPLEALPERRLVFC